MYLLMMAIGILIGILITKSIPMIKEIFESARPKKWRVRFHTYFILHENGERTNSAIKSPSVDIFVSAKNEDEAGDLVLEMIEKELRIDIESIELWMSDVQ